MPPTGRIVRITVTDALLTVNPFRIKLRSSGEEVVWKCPNGTVQVLFNKDGSPFNPATFPGGAGPEIHSGACAVTTNRLYHCTLIVNRPGSGRPITIDPEVDIDDSTPPPVPRGRKKAAKKKSGKKKSAKKKPAKKKSAKKK